MVWFGELCTWEMPEDTWFWVRDVWKINGRGWRCLAVCVVSWESRKGGPGDLEALGKCEWPDTELEGGVQFELQPLSSNTAQLL